MSKKDFNCSQCLTEETFQTLLNISKCMVYEIDAEMNFLEVKAQCQANPAGPARLCINISKRCKLK